MEFQRKPTIQEERLLDLLVKRSYVEIPENWKDGLLVLPMDDGGMGSLYLFPHGIVMEGRALGEQVSNFQFTDLDGVEIIASLNLDKNGNLFELDIWKTNFEKIVKLPDL